MLGGGSEEHIKQLTDMGFERSQAVAALQAAFGNADRAVEYLMGGIPDGLDAGGGEPGGGDDDDGGEEDGGEEGGGEGGEGGDAPAPLFNLRNVLGGAQGGAPGAGAGGGDASPLAELRAHPQFMQMVALIQANPALLQPLLQEIGANNPQFLQMINEHQDEFMAILQQPVPPGAAGGGGAGAAPRGNVIQVTPEEREAITRVRAPRRIAFARHEACARAPSKLRSCAAVARRFARTLSRAHFRAQTFVRTLSRAHDGRALIGVLPAPAAAPRRACSSRALAFRASAFSRHTSRATRTRNSPQTISLITATRTTTTRNSLQACEYEARASGARGAGG